MEAKYWQGKLPDSCQICKTKLINLTTIIDGATNMGPWAIMCYDCHRRHGVGLGTGRGQRYNRQEDGRWLKIGG